MRIGLEAGPLSQWLFAGMREAALAVELLETRHVRDAFKAMPVKSDRKDARGIAQLMRLRPVHCKSLPAQETRALLTARKLVQAKLHDVEMSLRGILRGFGLKVGVTTPRTFEARVRELVTGHPTLTVIAQSLLTARGALVHEVQGLERRVRRLARDDARARLLMSTPDVGVDRGPDLRRRDRRSQPVPVVQGGGRAFRPDAEEVPVGRDERHRADLEDRRCRRACRALRASGRGILGSSGENCSISDDESSLIRTMIAVGDLVCSDAALAVVHRAG